MTVLIDSCGWIEYFSEGQLADKYAKFIEKVNMIEYITPSIVLYEVYKRIKSVKGEQKALTAVAQIMAYTTVIAIDSKIALVAAEISLSSKLPMADSLIKAVAKDFDAKIVTSDEHFKNFPDAVFIN
ncbi:MAG: type II toxin-antitoxin system VapC family toxin [Candidatus Aenigmarchaeota archaeon]|nr:type II toxin-antitoxin system VapC family toxin [Candidatus Aenigmarchaeota archaeon]